MNKALLCLALFAAPSLSLAATVRPATSAEVTAIRAAFQLRLMDADSAKFLDVRTNGDVWCGKVNAKNALGAYVGYRMFMASVFGKADGLAKTTAIVIGVDTDGSATAQQCATHGL